MPGSPVRFGVPNPNDPMRHDLPPLRYGAVEVPVRLEIRRMADGTWWGRLLFGDGDGDERATADIFCARSESDLWESVHGLRDHHVRDLYRSVVE